MKRLPAIAILLFLACFVPPLHAAVLYDQTATLHGPAVERGPNWSSQGDLPRQGTGLSPTAGQFQSAVVWGAISVPGNSNTPTPNTSLEADADNLDLPRIKLNGQTKWVLRAQAGGSYMSRTIAFYFGSVIAPPNTDIDGAPLVGVSSAEYWEAEPFSLNNHDGSKYYWSKHAQSVFAVEAGSVEITWRKRQSLGNTQPADYVGNENKKYTQIGGLYYQLFPSLYVVSGAAFKTPRKMYWTQSIYRGSGKSISIPAGTVQEVHFVYNSSFPKQVAPNELVLPFTDPPGEQSTNTVWYDQGLISAYNREGRLFMELLGEATQGSTRRHLGYEILDVTREPTPADMVVELGERLTAYPGNTPSDVDLAPELLGGSFGTRYTFQRNLAKDGKAEFYATRVTENVNDVKVHWMETGLQGIRWPKRFVRYQQVWPTNPARFSQYARSVASTDAEARATAVKLFTDNVPFIEYEDPDPSGLVRSKLTQEFSFYTILDESFPSTRTLLRYNVGEHVAFERVYSFLNNNLRAPSFNPSQPSFLAIGLDGSSNSFASLPQVAVGSNSEGSYTIESWVQTSASVDGAKWFELSNGPGVDTISLALAKGPNAVPELVHTVSGQPHSLLGASSLPRGEWFHLAVVYNGATGVATIYTNANVMVSGSLSPPTAGVRSQNFLGRGASDTAPRLLASIAQFRVWSSAISQELLAAGMFKTFPPGTSGLAAQYLFHNDSGDSLREIPDTAHGSGPLKLADGVQTVSPLLRPRLSQSIAFVGQRLLPPIGEASSDSDLRFLAGHIRQDQGDSFSVTAYKDPLVVGLEEAAQSSIIPVNAGQNSNVLEVWWFRKNALDAVKGFKPIHWPSVVSRYELRWPEQADGAREIVLASNDGSGPLSSLAAKGGLYIQNDRTKPGFNPNEEHAILQGGQAYALRDDLNVIQGSDYTSHPYVLLQYVDADSRPSMSVFKVLREKGKDTFDYSVNAGTILQAPMPLPLLDKPLVQVSAGSPPQSINHEIFSWKVQESSFSTSPLQESVQVVQKFLDQGFVPILVDEMVLVNSPVPAGYVVKSTTVNDHPVGYHVLKTPNRNFVRPLTTLVLQDLSKKPIPTHWFLVTEARPDAYELEGVTLSRPPIELQPWTGAQPSGRSVIFGASFSGAISANTPVFIQNTASRMKWNALFRGLTPSGDGVRLDLLDFQNAGPLPAELAQADRLLVPTQNGNANAFAGFRLGTEQIPPAMASKALADRYAAFTFQDRKGNVWVYRGPHHAEHQSELIMRFYYKTLEGFFFPSLPLAQQPPLGTLTPYLRARMGEGFEGDPVHGDLDGDGTGDENAFGVRYHPVWPKTTPVMFMAESLTAPKRGLPAVRGQSSLEVLYQQSQAEGDGNDERVSVVLHDPTREKVTELAAPGSADALDAIPDSIAAQALLGRTFFPNLPPHLKDRFYFDANRGLHGSLVLKGQFVDEGVGDDYLLLNTLGPGDQATLASLCSNDDTRKSQWDNAVSSLTTVVETFIPNTAKPGTFIPDERTSSFSSSEIVEIQHPDSAVDSYALSATGPGTGYVTLVAGNGLAFTKSDDPVSVHIIRVVDTLYKGELKIVSSSNPLSEKLTLAQVVDLAGKTDDYEFEWKLTAPVDGAAPPVYQNTRRLLLGDGLWSHVPFPLEGEGASNSELIPAHRRLADVSTSLVSVGTIPFTSISTNGQDIVVVTTASLAQTLVPGNQLQLSDSSGRGFIASISANQAIDVAGAPASSLTLRIDPSQTEAPSSLNVAKLIEAVDPARPSAILSRDVTVSEGIGFTQFYFSMDLAPGLSAKVYINGSPAVVATLSDANTPTTTAPAGFSPLSKVYRLGSELFTQGTRSNASTTHRIVVELFSNATLVTAQTFNARLEAYEAIDQTTLPATPWLSLDPVRYPDKVRAVLGGTADVRSLSDNYLISRYRASNPAHASFNRGWSQWTDPQLAEGWIKRVLAGINPFNQRTSDLFNNQVNTDVSIITQAGPRWEGDVALNQDNLNDFGLIEIYETVLRRGRQLSIDAGINYGPANDALLLAAGYLNDLYMMLGNEAYADAANPTIGIGTKDKTYGDIATALFAFKGQVPSLLEEELGLLRGRDDFQQPGVQFAPVYNRLFWNYTRGIDSGEVIYAINYNVQENAANGANGVINADDARKMFPQGHGDAYGHYLTAIKGYYGLMMSSDFDWVPRAETVSVLGKPVTVDYQDERKFAAAAALLARAGRQVYSLTWRKDYIPGQDTGWEHFSPTRDNTAKVQPTTRYWGADHWASRTMQGAYLNWALGNAILPAVDPDPSHEGVQKIDRTTVPELQELVTTATDLASEVDNTEGRLTPLGLPDGAVAFDIDPTLTTGKDSQSHFEQIYDRAKLALRNATSAFDDAKDVTRLLRSEQDSLAELQASIARQELAYTNSLIELYGTPYPDDVGPGRSYRQDYAGPDLLHYLYVENPENTFAGSLDLRGVRTFRVDVQSFPEGWRATAGEGFDFIKRSQDGSYTADEHFIEFNLNSHGYFSKPETWTGRRKSPGKIQAAISDVILSHHRLAQSLDDAQGAKEDLDRALGILQSQRNTYSTVHSIQESLLINDFVLKGVTFLVETYDKYGELKGEMEEAIVAVVQAALPDSLVAGLAAGGDLTSGAESAIEGTKYASKIAYDWGALILDIATRGYALSSEIAAAKLEFYDIGNAEHAQETLEAVNDLIDPINALADNFYAINEKLRLYDNAQRNLASLVSQGERIQQEREIFRQRSASLVQGFRTRDAAFRIFRTEKLERYKSLFELAARYTYIAANAYDYDTGLLNTSHGKAFINRIVNSRSLGVLRDGEPQYAGSNTGDPGLSSVLAEMRADWDVLRGRLGFNNPSGYGTTVSLRTEKERIIPQADGDSAWKDILQQARKANILDDEDVRQNCMQIDRGTGLPVPGLVLEFSTTIADGLNLFGKPLSGGDHYFDPSFFATKIFSVGLAFEGYIGMDNPVANSSAVNSAGGYSPADPSTSFLGSKSLAATPGIYLIPVGVDSMRSPPLGDASNIRSWSVDDVAVPLPFNIGGSTLSTKGLWQSSESLSEPLFTIRKHAAFRPVSTAAAFSSSIYGGGGSLQFSQFTNTRLIGRSAWNSKWKIVIPGHKLLGSPEEGLDRFIETVKDIKIHFVTYSYAGN